ncbi:M48 family metallopeptidase [Olsenella sp. Marseille-P4559]|uniref:M48 family metallopeptidase n=1 Tax=Olsenella sp. Marseille-P4559 TaxID=2364795 RepID=UPI00103089F2|nr:M48 family metallopeptidase [Olsenella sp. Marseille-P4559]
MRGAKMQERFDALLAECDSCLRRIGILPRECLPSVRLTHNRSRIGSCKKLRGGRRPLFQISYSVDACKTDALARDVLFHELIHTLPGCFDHGERFHAAAARVNAAYGADVRATRRVPSQEVPVANKLQVEGLVGKSFFVRGKCYTFAGSNSRPKRCCDLRDARGRTYVCAPAYVLAHISAD